MTYAEQCGKIAYEAYGRALHQFGVLEERRLPRDSWENLRPEMQRVWILTADSVRLGIEGV